MFLFILTSKTEQCDNNGQFLNVRDNIEDNNKNWEIRI